MSVDFKGAHYHKSVILYAFYFYVRYGVSYSDLEEIMEERRAEVDHATLNRWVIKFSPMIAANVQARKRPTAVSWRMDETYIKVKGRFTSQPRSKRILVSNRYHFGDMPRPRALNRFEPE